MKLYGCGRAFIRTGMILSCLPALAGAALPEGVSFAPTAGVFWIQGDIVRASYGSPIAAYGGELSMPAGKRWEISLLGLFARMDGTAPFTLPLPTGPTPGSAPVHHKRTIALLNGTYNFPGYAADRLIPFVTFGIGVAYIEENTDPTTAVTPLGTLALPADGSDSPMLANLLSLGIKYAPDPHYSLAFAASFLGIPAEFDDPHQVPGARSVIENSGGAMLYLRLAGSF